MVQLKLAHRNLRYFAKHSKGIDKDVEFGPRAVALMTELQENLDRVLELMRLYVDIPPVYVSEQRVAAYGLTVEQATAMLTEQGYRCAICRVRFVSSKSFHIDHNHETGAVRGVLCTRCNFGLGQLKDSPVVLRAALAYLERHGFYGPATLPEDDDQ